MAKPVTPVSVFSSLILLTALPKPALVHVLPPSEVAKPWGMARVGQPVYLFQLTFVPPQARDTRHAAMHGETVAYAFGTLGQSIVTGHGFRDRQTAERASRLRRGGVEDDFGPVDASTEGRKLSQTMMDYLVAFMRTGVPKAEEAPAWLPYSVQTPNVMVFGNSGVSAR